MKGFEIKIAPEKEMISVAINAACDYAEKFLDNEKEVKRLGLAIEEAIANVVTFSLSDTLEHIKIKAIAEEGELKISILDKGIPGNYDELSDEDSLGLTIMRKSVDQVNLYNYGPGGRCQELIKHIYKMPDFALDAEKKAIETFTPKEINIIPSRKEDMLMVTRGIYEEFGMTYPKDYAYYPDKLWDKIQSGSMFSTVAVDEEGRTLGHFSIWEWDTLPGIWESGMAVVNKAARGAGVFSHLYPYVHNYASENLPCGFHIGTAITTHPYSQKGAYKFGSRAVAFSLNLTASNSLMSDIKREAGPTDTAERDSYVYTGICFDKDMRDVYGPEEVKWIIESRYEVLGIERNIITEPYPIEPEQCESTMSMSSAFGIAQTYYYTLGKDFESRLEADIMSARKNSMATMELNIIMDQKGITEAYEIAKSKGFFFTGTIPGSAKGDVFIMYKTLTAPVNYDKMVVLDEYKDFLAAIRALDPDQKKK